MSITFNGTTSDTIGVIVERVPNRHVPTRRYNPVSIAGRNGDILMTDESFPNVIQEYEVYLSKSANDMPMLSKNCAGWLCSPKGYARLEDSFDTYVYREAYLSDGFDIENMLNQFGRAKIAFSCKPQKFLKTGETQVTITSPHTLTNPTVFDAKPLIYVNTSTDGTIDIDGVEIECAAGEYYIDCDSQNAYFGTVNMNSYINAPVFPVLSGTSVVTLTTITTCKITPRWWTL